MQTAIGYGDFKFAEDRAMLRHFRDEGVQPVNMQEFIVWGMAIRLEQAVRMDKIGVRNGGTESQCSFFECSLARRAMPRTPMSARVQSVPIA